MHKAKQWLYLSLWIAGTWAFLFVFTPFLLEHNDAAGKMSAFIEDTGIDTGQFYYSDLEECAEAELGTRSTFEYMPATMAEIAANSK